MRLKPLSHPSKFEINFYFVLGENLTIIRTYMSTSAQTQKQRQRKEHIERLQEALKLEISYK